MRAFLAVPESVPADTLHQHRIHPRQMAERVKRIYAQTLFVHRVVPCGEDKRPAGVSDARHAVGLVGIENVKVEPAFVVVSHGYLVKIGRFQFRITGRIVIGVVMEAVRIYIQNVRPFYVAAQIPSEGISFVGRVIHVQYGEEPSVCRMAVLFQAACLRASVCPGLFVASANPIRETLAQTATVFGIDGENLFIIYKIAPFRIVFFPSVRQFACSAGIGILGTGFHAANCGVRLGRIVVYCLVNHILIVGYVALAAR